MALLTILTYPDPRLHKVALPVATVDARIQTLIDDMLETMYEAKGIGLAATQVDVHERLLVMDLSEEHNSPMVLVNPQIEWSSNDHIKSEEGCLSVPGVYDDVERAFQVRVKALDRHGQPITWEAEGMASICVQHEIDHLNGKVFVEHLSFLKRTRIKTKMLKAQRELHR